MDIIPSPKKNIVLDATFLSTFMNCELKADFRFNHSLVPNAGKSNSLEVGSLVHKVLEVFYQSKINGLNREQSIAHAMIAGEQFIKEEMTNTPAESDAKNTGWKWAMQTCEEYFEFYRNDSWVPIFVERVIGKVLYEDDDIRVLWKAKLDRAVDTNQGIFPVDVKTMKQRRDTISLNNQFIGQCLVMDTRTMFVEKVGFQTSLKPIDKFIRAPINYSADRLMEWQSITLPTWAYKLVTAQESGNWAQNFSSCETKYGFCDYKEVCESDRNMREEVFKMKFMKAEEWNPVNAEE